MPKTIIWISFLFSAIAANAQLPKITDTASYAVIRQSAARFPKFYREFEQMLATDTLIKAVSFIRQGGMGPAFASPKGVITFNLDYFVNPKPAFEDNRLIVVLYHELGHLHYYTTVVRSLWNPENSEKAAFEYSLLKTKELAAAGDCSPLQTGLRFMKLRSEGTDLSDPHVRALKRMVNEPLYAAYLKYTEENCRMK